MRCNLKAILESKRKSQAELARETGINKNTISALCRNKANGVSFEAMAKICAALQCDLADILHDD